MASKMHREIKQCITRSQDTKPSRRRRHDRKYDDDGLHFFFVSH